MPTSNDHGPLVVGIGGATRPNSSTEKALSYALECAARRGARTVLLGAADLQLPSYAPENSERGEAATNLVRQLRRADGVIVASPGYHGGISGLVKNALDYAEDMREDDRPYLDGRAVGCIASAAGWQGATTTLTALRAVVHALRGWPTPFGAAINSTEPAFDAAGACLSAGVGAQLDILASQVVEFANAFAAARARAAANDEAAPALGPA